MRTKIMPTFTKVSDRGWLYRWDRFDDYDITTDSDTKIVLTYSEDRGGEFDAERSFASISMNVVDGLIKKVVWRNEEGENEGVLKGVSFDTDLLRILFHEDVQNENDIYGMMVGGGTTFDMVNQARENSGFDVTTGVGDDVVRAKGGSSYIKDAGGADRYIGDGNNDTVTYDEWFWRAPERVERGVRADLREEYAIGPDGERDVLVNIDNVRGTFKKDMLLGNGDNNEFMGFYGKDTFDGRGGYDKVSYRNDHWQGGYDGVTVNLAKGFGIDGFGKRDMLISIEEAAGTQYDDVLMDDKKDNALEGREGDDRFILRGGNDRAEGGDGADTFVFKGNNFGFDDIEDFNPEDGDRIKIAAADGLGDVDIGTNDDGERFITFNNSEIFLNNYEGDVADYLIF